MGTASTVSWPLYVVQSRVVGVTVSPYAALPVASCSTVPPPMGTRSRSWFCSTYTYALSTATALGASVPDQIFDEPPPARLVWTTSPVRNGTPLSKNPLLTYSD